MSLKEQATEEFEPSIYYQYFATTKDQARILINIRV
jgi:hypothetical protein